jgi:hypothetical protein
VTILVNNNITTGPKKFDVKAYANSTIWEVRSAIAKHCKVTPDRVRLHKGGEVMNAGPHDLYGQPDNLLGSHSVMLGHLGYLMCVLSPCHLSVLQLSDSMNSSTLGSAKFRLQDTVMSSIRTCATPSCIIHCVPRMPCWIRRRQFLFMRWMQVVVCVTWLLFCFPLGRVHRHPGSAPSPS